MAEQKEQEQQQSKSSKEQDKSKEKSALASESETPTPFNPGRAALPDVMSHIVKMLLEDRKLLPQAKKTLEIWWLAQAPENRKENANNFRRIMMDFKLIGESLHGTAVELTMGDVQ